MFIYKTYYINICIFLHGTILQNRIIVYLGMYIIEKFNLL